MRLGVLTLPVLLASCTTNRQDMPESRELVQQASERLHLYVSSVPEITEPHQQESQYNASVAGELWERIMHNECYRDQNVPILPRGLLPHPKKASVKRFASYHDDTAITAFAIQETSSLRSLYLVLCQEQLSFSDLVGGACFPNLVEFADVLGNEKDDPIEVVTHSPKIHAVILDDIPYILGQISKEDKSWELYWRSIDILLEDCEEPPVSYQKTY